MARVELKEQEVENVVGGAFNFYTKDNQLKCYVDNIGTFYCNETAFNWVINKTADMSTPAADVVNEALAMGYFWQ